MNISAFLSYIFLSCFTPGPNNIMSMNNSIKYGFKKGYPFCIGVFCGFFVVISLCAGFISLLFHYIPKIEPAMKWIGAAYMLFLAFVIFFGASHDKENGGKLKTNSISTGIVLQFINPKLYLFGITALSTFVLPHYKSAQAVVPFLLIMSLMALASTTTWCLFGSLFQRMFSDHRKWLNAIMALLLVYCAVITVIS